MSFVNGSQIDFHPESGPVPDRVPSALVCPFDHHHAPELIADPFGAMADVQAEHAVVFSDKYGGFWVVTRWEEQREVLQNAELFSSKLTAIPGATYFAGNELLPLQVDPPDHAKYRALINPAFAPRRINSLEPTIRTTTNELIDGILAKETNEVDFMAAYAEPLPSLIFCSILGLPQSEHKRFAQWVDATIHTPLSEEGLKIRTEAGQQINSYLAGLIAERAESRQDDLVSTLIDSEVDGVQLTLDEVRRVVFLLFLAGLDTVTSALGWSFHYLAEHPEVRALIASDLSRVDDAVEELLRLHSFVNQSRTVTRDVDFHGVQMKQGDRVLVYTSIGSRDPSQFPHPHEFDLDRKPNRHLAFAAGPHRCGGSHLARMEMQISIEEWLKRVPNFHVRPGFDVPIHLGGVTGIEELPLIMGSRS